MDDGHVLAVDWAPGGHDTLHLRAHFSDTPSTRMQRTRGQVAFLSEPTIADDAGLARLGPCAVLDTLETRQYQ